MIWTTKQKDGTFRTIDTSKATLWDLLLEWFMMLFVDNKDSEVKSGKK